MTETEQMLTTIFDCRRVDLYVDRKPMNEAQQSLFQKMQERRQNGEPLQYILGSCEFMGLRLHVNEHVLIPRPETEILVESAIHELTSLHRTQRLKILELGTGSGNIAVSLAKFLDNVHVTTLDVSSDAIHLAEKNARQHGVEDKITFLHADLISFLKNQCQEENTYDMIISNPPYVKTADIAHLPHDVQQEPRLALDGGWDGLDFLREIIRLGQDLLKERGLLLMEIGDTQREPLESMFREYAKYKRVEFKEDYTNTNRIVIAQ